MKKIILLFSVMWIANVCAQTIPNTVTLRDYFQGQVTFSLPVFMVPMPNKDSVYFVVEQHGNVTLVKRTGNAWAETTFVTVPVSFSGSAGAEDGLLGLAFHPNFAASKKYYLYFLRNVGG